MAISLADQLVRTNGRPSGFDYLRILLAVGVVAWHTHETVYGHAGFIAAATGPFRPLWGMILPMFFALSGFLVAGSLERSKSLIGFLGLRAIRIYPALIVEVVLSAFFLGLVFTTLPWDAYFRDPQFRAYLLNVTGDIHFRLPGVFLLNPFPAIVNAQLWTVPYELTCYVAFSILAALGIVKHRWISVVATGSLCAVAAIWHLRHGLSVPVTIPIVGHGLVLCFLAGVTLYLYRDRVPWRSDLGVAALFLSLALFFAPSGQMLLAFPAAYFTIWLGLANPARNRLLAGADYSYGLFLYGYPIQQAVAAVGPAFHHWWISLPVSLTIGIGVSWLSWHFVEKPSAKLRAPLFALESRALKWLTNSSTAYSPEASAPLEAVAETE